MTSIIYHTGVLECVLVYELRGDDHKPNIEKIVQEYEEKGGISKNEAANRLIDRHGGSRSTYWPLFDKLIKEKKIELRSRTKRQSRLYPTESKKKIQEFQDKMNSVNKLLNLLDSFPEIGDCFSLHETDKVPKLSSYYLREINLWKRVIGHTIDFQGEGNFPEVYCLQARHDILKDIPIFLVNYVNDPTNGFSSTVREEAMKIIQPIMVDCLKKIQKEYSKSPYYSNKFLSSQKTNTKISLIRELSIKDLSAEFLRILGRYYFLISKNLSKYQIDSCKEQKVISEFVRSFYSKSKIPNDKLSESLTYDLLIDYWESNQNPKKSFFKKGMVERLDEANQSLGGKFAKKFNRYENNDPFIIADFYNNWITEMGIFSLLEKRMIQTFFDYAEDYEIEGKTMDHDDPLEEKDYATWKDFRGKLYRDSEDKAKIILNVSYSEVEPHIGRWTRILIEE